ncbi:MAG: FAD-dependent oxidoreductase [Rhodocyclaceae bacterium]
MKRLLLIGGGHAHLFVLEAFIKAPLPGVELVLVTPTQLAPYSGMMPGVIAGHYRYDQGCVDLKPLCDAAGCHLFLTRAESVDATARQVVCADGRSLDYDVLSLDTGSTPGTSGLPGVEEYAHPVKPIDRFVADLNFYCARLAPDRPGHVAVVGAGASGCEVLLALQYRIEKLSAALRAGVVDFTLISDEPSPLSGLPESAQRRMARLLEQSGTRLILDTPAVGASAGAVIMGDGREIEADFIAWATGTSAPDWPRAAGLQCDEEGFVLINASLQSVSHASVFAAGDIATMVGQPRPKAGVYAVRAGPPLAHNLRAALTSEAFSEYLPQERAVALISTGEKNAIGVWGPLCWEGEWVWSVKDRIDRRFIERFSAANAVAAAPAA